MSIEKQLHNKLATFLEKELEHCRKLEKGFCMFGVGMPKAIAHSKAKSFLALEHALKMTGPFTKYMKDKANDCT